MKPLVICLSFLFPVYALVLQRTNPAPYYRHSNESLLVADEYGVVLVENYTLDAHFEFIEVNLEQNASIFARISVINAYRAKIDSYTVHNLIRYDPGVLYVQHDTFFEPDWEEHSEEGVVLPPEDLKSTKRAFGFETEKWNPCFPWIQMITNPGIQSPVPTVSALFVRNPPSKCMYYAIW
jgi:hypothetical protein